MSTENSMQRILDKLVEEIGNYYENVSDLKPVPDVSGKEIREYLDKHYDFKKPLPLEKLTGEVSEILRRWMLHTNHPQYFGLFVPGTMLASTIADALVALYNPQLGVWWHAPAACEIERFTLQYFLKKFGFPVEGSSANFTTGGTEANLSAVLAALIRYFPEYGDGGLQALKKQPVFYVSEEAHHSFLKIGQVCGMGYNAVRNVPVEDEFKLDMNQLNKMYEDDMQNGFAPFMVVGTAGTTSAGVIDRLPEIADFCKDRNLWNHVDAAYGGAAIMSPKLKTALKGIERADSITCDAHKWFSVSMSAGMFLCRHRENVTEAFHAGAAYLPATIKDTIDAFNTTIQCSRRFTGLKLFMNLAELGESGYIKLIERQADLGELLRRELTNSGFEVLNSTPLPVVCFTHKNIYDGHLTVEKVLERIYKDGNFWLSGTKLKNKIPAFRACIISFRTDENAVVGLSKALTKSVELKNKVSSTTR
jgi:aromatic-L-amino-acid decarboxylase